MIDNVRILVWFTLQFAIAAGAATGAIISVAAGFAVAAIALLASIVTLRLGWSARNNEDALKPVSNALAVFGLTIFLFLLFTQPLLWALGTLLFFAQLAMNVVMREYRQLYFGLVISFVYILGGAAEARSGHYLIVFILYGLSTSYCLAEAWLDRKTTVIKTLPAPPTWQRLKVAGSILTLALIIYLIMPRPPAANLGSQQSHAPDFYTNEQWEEEARHPERTIDEPSQNSQQQPDETERADNSTAQSGDAYRYEGFEEQLEIQQAGTGDTRNSNDIVAYMKAPHATYLKVRTFDHFDGARWSSSSQAYRRKIVETGKVELRQNQQSNFRHVLDIERTLSAQLPVAPQPVTLWLPASVIALDTWEQPFLPQPLRAGTRYTVDSHLEFIEGRPYAGDTPPLETDLQLPPDFDPRIAQLARRVTQDATGALAKATALEHHLRTAYDYSFQSIFDSQGFTPLSRFLFDEKRGHCEYFASAMAVMLRSLDIPARLVTGFSATQKNPLTGYYEIRALDGHAWVEAWIENTGWVTFEPTAFYQLPRIQEEPLSARQINDYVASLQQSNDALGIKDFSLTQLLSAIWQTLYSAAVIALSYIKLLLLHTWPYLTALFALTTGLILTRQYWRPFLLIHLSRWRIHRHKPGELQGTLHFYLFHLQRIAAYHGVERMPSDSIECWTQRLAGTFGANENFEALAQIVNQAFYAGQNMSIDLVRQTAIKTAEVLRKDTSG